MCSLTQHREERHLPSVCVHGSSSWKTESVSSSSSDSCSNKNQCVYFPSHKRSKHCTLNKISLLIHNLPTNKHGEYSLSMSPANSIRRAEFYLVSTLKKNASRYNSMSPWLTSFLHLLSYSLKTSTLLHSLITNSVGTQILHLSV